MSQRQYHLIGAFDRHNYGDILFPIVHSEFLMSKGVDTKHIHYHAISAADLRNVGGYLTTSVHDMLTSGLQTNDAVILCGGDILSADWLLMVGHLRSAGFMKLARVIRRILGVDMSNDLARAILGERHTYPYVVAPKDTSSHVYYTAVGGAGFQSNRQLERVCELLKGVDRLSVRDTQVQKLLVDKGLSPRLVPDTALIMSEFFKLEQLEDRNWSQILRIHGDFDWDRSFSFQGAKRLLESSLDELTEELILSNQLTGLSPVFVPIGRAPDHEDHVVLDELFQRLVARNVTCAYLDSEHVMDIMGALAKAQFYVGTSLHGAITTYAFGKKPCALFASKVTKLKDFLESWMTEGDYGLFDTASFSKSFSKIVDSGTEIKDLSKLRQHQNLVRQELLAYVDT